MCERKTELPESGLEGILYVMKRDDRYLIAKRVKEGSNFKDQFLFPGGLVENFDLSWEDAVKREILEERGVSINDPKFIATVKYPHPKGVLVTQHVFLIEEGMEGISNLEPNKEELFWMDHKELSEVCENIPSKTVLKLLEENGTFNEE